MQEDTGVKYRVGRTHKLFIHWKMRNPGVRVVEADTLKGKVGECVLFTLIFECGLILAFHKTRLSRPPMTPRASPWGSPPGACSADIGMHCRRRSLRMEPARSASTRRAPYEQDRSRKENDEPNPRTNNEISMRNNS